MNKAHPNEIILKKQTAEENEALMLKAVELGPKHSEALEHMARRQKDYVLDEVEYEVEMSGHPPVKIMAKTLEEAEQKAMELAVKRFVK